MQIEVDSGADAELFEAIRHNNTDWRGLLFRRYERMVRSLIAHHLRSHDQVEDLVSEVFLRFFEGRTRIRSAHGVRNYLYSIALYTVRNDIRLRKRERGMFSTSVIGFADDASSCDDPHAHAALRALGTILNDMRPLERNAYLLRRIAGLNLPQVARALGVSQSTAKRRVRSARRVVEKRAARNALLSDYVRRSIGAPEPRRDADTGT